MLGDSEVVCSENPDRSSNFEPTTSHRVCNDAIGADGSCPLLKRGTGAVTSGDRNDAWEVDLDVIRTTGYADITIDLTSRNGTSISLVHLPPGVRSC